MNEALLKLLLILIYAGLSASGLAILKAAASPFSLPYIAGFLIYGLAFAIWLFVILPILPLSVAFPVSAGAIVIATVLLGHFALGEPATARKISGSLLIIIGILTIYIAPSPVGPGSQSTPAGGKESRDG